MKVYAVVDKEEHVLDIMDLTVYRTRAQAERALDRVISEYADFYEAHPTLYTGTFEIIELQVADEN